MFVCVTVVVCGLSPHLIQHKREEAKAMLQRLGIGGRAAEETEPARFAFADALPAWPQGEWCLSHASIWMDSVSLYPNGGC